MDKQKAGKTITIKGKRWDGKPFSKEIDVSATSVSLYDEGLTEVDLRPLIHCSELEYLGLGNNMLYYKPLDLSFLSRCTRLKSIDLSGDITLASKETNVTEVVLPSAPALENLCFEYNDIEQIDLSPLKKSLSFKTLDLRCNWLNSIDLTPLKSCKHLKTIDLYTNNLKQIDLSPLKDHTQLEELSLGNNELEKIDLNPLRQCTGLKNLLLNNNKLKRTDLSSLAKCENLHTLDISHNDVTAIDLAGLKDLQKLSVLKCGYNPVVEIDLSALNSLSGLTELEIHMNNQNRQTLDFFKFFKTLTLLSFSGILFDQDLHLLKGFNKVNALFLDRAGLTGFQVSDLGNPKILEKLSLAGNRIRTFDFNQVKVCKNLTYLNLSGNLLESVDLYPLNKCRSLQYISLTSNRLKECDMTPLLSIDTLGTGDFFFSKGFSIDENVNLFARKSFAQKTPPRGLWEVYNRINWK